MKTAIVTGASSGIGKEIASRLLSLGYRVLGVGRSVSDELFDSADFTSFRADLSNEKETLACARS